MSKRNNLKSFLINYPYYNIKDKVVLYSFGGNQKGYYNGTTYFIVSGVFVVSKRIYNASSEEQKAILDAIHSGNLMSGKDLPTRHNIAGKLASINDMAIKKASAILHITYHIVDDNCIIRFLNSKMELPIYTTFPQYKDQEAALIMEMIKSLTFVNELTDFAVKEIDNPATKLSILRSQRLVGIPVEIPQELVEQSKNRGGRVVANLWNELEKMGIEVAELFEEKKGQFGYKIYTPIGSHIGYGSKNDIVRLAERDIKLSDNAKCPACSNKIDYTDRNFLGIMLCQCGSLIGSIPENLALHAVRAVETKYGINGIYTVLKNWDTIYLYNHDIDYDFLLFGCKQEITPIPVNFGGNHQKCSERTTATLPVFGCWEDFEDVAAEYAEFVSMRKAEKDFKFGLPFLIPSCEHCKHCVPIEDNSNAILGLYDNITGERHICVYPLSNKEIDDKLDIELSFDYEKIRGYKRNNEGIIRNAFLRALLVNTISIDRQSRQLEAMVRHPFNAFHGPICPSFVLDSDNLDLKENAGPFEVIGNISVQFGVKNTNAIAKEKTEAEQKEFAAKTVEKANLLLVNDNHFADVVKRRIEIKNLNSDGAKIANCLASHFTAKELFALKSHAGRFINASHKSLPRIIDMAVRIASD